MTNEKYMEGVDDYFRRKRGLVEISNPS